MGATVCRTHGGASPQVKAKAAQRVKDLLTEAIGDPFRSLREAARLAYADTADACDERGGFSPNLRDWPEDIRRCVKRLRIVRGNIDRGDGKFDEILDVEFWDKSRMVENLMKRDGHLTEKVEVSGELDIVERLAAGRKRVADAREKR
jgi:hypothetical protein